jgi:uncharacterized membrane protein
MGERPRPIDYASPQEPRSNLRWLLIGILAVVAFFATVWIFLIVMRMY